MTNLQSKQIASFMRAFLSTGGRALSGDLTSEGYEQALTELYNNLIEVFTVDGFIELKFGDQVVYLNDQKLRLSGAAGERLNQLLAAATQSAWAGFRCDEVPNEDQLAAVMSRFAQPELSDQDQGLQRRRGPFRWIGEELVDDAFDNLPTPLEALSADALEHSSMRKVQIEEIQNALGTQAGAALEEVTFIYARFVYFIDRFMATMEPAGPRVPLDESSRIICDLIDVFERDPKAFMAVSMARPQVGNYDAFHQANTALLAIAMGASVGLGRELLFELGMAALLHQIGIVDMPDRIRSSRVLQREEREILSQLPYRTVRRLLQAKGPDLHGMARINAILAMKDRIATKTVGGDGKTRWVAAKPAPPLLARILAVAARYDALTSDREFRPAMSPENTIQLMLRQPASLDGRLVRLVAKLKNVGTTPAGSAAG